MKLYYIDINFYERKSVLWTWVLLQSTFLHDAQDKQKETWRERFFRTDLSVAVDFDVAVTIVNTDANNDVTDAGVERR